MQVREGAHFRINQVRLSGIKAQNTKSPGTHMSTLTNTAAVCEECSQAGFAQSQRPVDPDAPAPRLGTYGMRGR